MGKDKLSKEGTEKIHSGNKIIPVPEDYIEQIKCQLAEIEKSCDNDGLKEKISKLTGFINNNILKYDIKKKDAENLIYNKMVEVKYKDKDLNTNLYILYQDLKHDRISLERAIEIFNTYELMEFL